MLIQFYELAPSVLNECYTFLTELDKYLVHQFFSGTHHWFFNFQWHTVVWLATVPLLSVKNNTFLRGYSFHCTRHFSNNWLLLIISCFKYYWGFVACEYTITDTNGMNKLNLNVSYIFWDLKWWVEILMNAWLCNRFRSICSSWFGVRRRRIVLQPKCCHLPFSLKNITSQLSLSVHIRKKL